MRRSAKTSRCVLFTSRPRHQKIYFAVVPWQFLVANPFNISKKMELVKDFVNNQLYVYLPVVFVIVVVILVFAFGFKSAEQPPFDKLTNDDRKQAGKRKKIKEKVRFLSVSSHKLACFSRICHVSIKNGQFRVRGRGNICLMLESGPRGPHFC